jgi:hypothetical protein
MKSGYPKWSEVDGKRCPDLLGRLIDSGNIRPGNISLINNIFRFKTKFLMFP